MIIKFDTANGFLATDIINMSETLKIELLKIADNLSKEHKDDYTENRIMATFMLLAHLYQEIENSRKEFKK